MQEIHIREVGLYVRTSFVSRHIGPSAAEQAEMLASLGYSDLNSLTEAALPAQIADGDLALPEPLDEASLQSKLLTLSQKNNPKRAMIGLGYSGTITPAVIRRNLLEDPTWYTAYTPYQPEISQGRLEALLNFQTMVTDLTGLDLAGASLLDESTAAAEAMSMARRITKKGNCFVVDAQVLPATLAVIRTRARALGIEIVVEKDVFNSERLDEAFAVIVQQPGVDGIVKDRAELALLAERLHKNDALLIAAVDLLSLTMMPEPASYGADVAVGTSQRFGVPLFFGGPHAGFLATKKEYERQLPGRLVGVSKDAQGTPALRLALQTREQHIRREKATSNICTSQVLLAAAASMYAVYHGPTGLRSIAEHVHDQARRLAGAVLAAGYELKHQHFFDTIVVRKPGAGQEMFDRAAEAGIHVRLRCRNSVAINVGEDATEDDLVALAGVFGAELAEVRAGTIGELRRSAYLTHPVFNTYHSETRMMRYLHTLKSRDFALDTGMIPLGSCTMKLNSATEMEAISYPGFANLHPYVPAGDAQGFSELLAELREWLITITGYDAVSLQPNSGAQGEYAGLTAIKRYHESNGDYGRTICLIPASAHGTNAASAAMAGLDVIIVKTGVDGSIDFADLEAKVDKHSEKLACIMITYPSTHGVFETRIPELAALVHDAGGQVYIDGANMNALVGLAKPGKFGGDVSHLNLHKTFAIPHGGGGPGVGPIGVKAHLAAFLPKHPFTTTEEDFDTISESPYGSPGVMPISYAYIAMMGGDGLRLATQVAVLNANYLANRLRDYYPVLYAGDNGLVAHECILDLRPLTASTKVTVDDVAKRLIDYGFHAPTMSFPVPGTLMVEPTESEDLYELDRFADAMIAIRGEIDLVAAGEWPADDNPLVNAPHPQSVVSADVWEHPYSRTIAASPQGRVDGLILGGGGDKYWPPVARIDGAWGDRNLMCTCPDLSSYED